MIFFEKSSSSKMLLIEPLASGVKLLGRKASEIECQERSIIRTLLFFFPHQGSNKTKVLGLFRRCRISKKEFISETVMNEVIPEDFDRIQTEKMDLEALFLQFLFLFRSATEERKSILLLMKCHLQVENSSPTDRCKKANRNRTSKSPDHISFEDSP